MKKIYFLSIFLLLLSSCTRSAHYKNVHGHNEFVVDSQKIQEGKSAILELNGQVFDELSPLLLEEYKDVIHEEDVLNIVVYHPSRPDLMQIIEKVNTSLGYRVTEGKITLPELGKVELSGLTLDEAEQKLHEELGKEISDIEVFIAYKKRLAQKVDLMGMVEVSSMPVNGKRRLYEILANAGIDSEANLFMSYVIRGEKILPVDIYRLIKKGDMNQNIVMRGGDKVYIAKPLEAKVIVMGEVLAQSHIPITSGFMPLPEALAAAGGLNYLTANLKHIYVIRGSLSTPKVYDLTWNHIVNLSNYNLLLVPGDIVFVASKPITKWNRFISQILPTATVLERGSEAIYRLKKTSD